MFILQYFVVGGIPSVSWFRDTIIIRAVPIAAVASTLVMLRVMYANWTRNRMGKPKLVGFFATFAFMTIMAFTYGQLGSEYLPWYGVLFTVPTAATYCVVAFSLSSLMVTVLKPKNPANLLMIVTIILVFMAMSAVGEMVWLPFQQVGRWIHDYAIIGPYNVLWMGVYLSYAVVVIRTIFGKERLRAA
jgi:ABC-type Fe3+-siderophore transport system permease subunit